MSGRTGLLIGVVIIAVIFAAATVVTHNMLTEPFPGHNDFMSRWEGARSYFVDHLNPYGDEASLNIQQRIFGRPAHEDEDPGYFAYPMYTALLVWPLVYMPYAWASAIWMVLLEALLIGSLFLLFDLFRWKPKPLLLGVFLLWVLFFYYSARGLILGQPGVVVYFLEVLTVWGLAKKHDRVASVALALSTIKPQMGFLIVPFLLLWGLRERRWQFVISFIVAMLILLGASFVMQPSWLGDWLGQLGRYTSYTALGSPVWIITNYYLHLGNWAEIAVDLVFAAFMLVSWYGVLWQSKSERWLWAVVLTLTVTHLVAARTATPHYVVFIIPLVFYCVLISQRNRRRGGLWIGLLLLVFLVIPWLHFLVTVKGEFEHPTVYLPLPLIMFGLLGWTRKTWWQLPAAADTGAA